ncbi:hypothetical protein KAU55_00570 [Candidatus Bathyarchaeota archaeon]|nr:hypothetical protein [Candidatus Bathyarchaeota archaeon]
MSELEGITTYFFMWHSQPDACLRCAALNGRGWRTHNITMGMLVDVSSGLPVWDIEQDRSMMHGGTGKHCRCQVTVHVEFDWSKWEELNDFRNEIRSWR